MSEEPLPLDREIIYGKKTQTFDRVIWKKCFDEKEDYTKKTADGKAKEYKIEAYLVNGDIGFSDIRQMYTSWVYHSVFTKEQTEQKDKFDLIDLQITREVTEEDIKLINGDKDEISKYTEVYNYNGYLCAETVFIPGEE